MAPGEGDHAVRCGTRRTLVRATPLIMLIALIILAVFAVIAIIAVAAIGGLSTNRQRMRRVALARLRGA